MNMRQRFFPLQQILLKLVTFNYVQIGRFRSVEGKDSQELILTSYEGSTHVDLLELANCSLIALR